MQAIICPRYGSPDVLELREVAQPVPGPREVLVKVHAAAANPADWRRMRGEPFMVRLTDGLRRPRQPVLGADIAGRVEAVGAGVTQLKPGDAVFGELAGGGFAEFALGTEKNLAPMPANTTFEAAAAVPLAGLTALQGLRDFGRVRAGQKVLINGASGGVGTFAVQIARAYGAAVTGVSSGRNQDLVRSLGAEQVIDYTQTDFTQSAERYDVIFDTVANRTVAEYGRALASNGVCVVAGFSSLRHLLHVVLAGGWAGRRTGQRIGIMGSAGPNRRDLDELRALIEAGQVIPVIDRRYPLREVPDALRYLETGRARGKVSITFDAAGARA